MNARSSKLLFSFALIIVLALPTLAFSLPVGAQEAGPPRVGLRPDAPPYALHGPYWVGMMEYEAKTDFHDTTVAVWYPALNPSGANELVTYQQFISGLGSVMEWKGHALENATPEPKGGPYPLLIFAHGGSTSRFTSSYLTEHLASYGFVVMAIDYADSWRTPPGYDVTLSLYTRPKDVSWQIDYADRLTGPGEPLQGMIDTQHIAVVGYSYGGYTALAAGGASLDVGGATSWCTLYPDLKWPPERGGFSLRWDLCGHARQVADLAGLETVPEGLWPSWGDSRVKAIVPLAPGPILFGSESARGVTIPAMVLIGSKDRSTFSDMPLYQPYVYDNLGSEMKSLVVFENADHSIYVDSCSAAPWQIDLGAFWLCSDPVWDMDRAHDLINHFTTAFLLATLKGDTDAPAALAPDAVSFPGIMYETTGF
jgi:predicted dienelactone hydrolase